MMTPAIKLLDAKKIEYKLHSYQHDPKIKEYGMEAITKLGSDPYQTYKTLVVELNDNPKQLAVMVVPIAAKLSFKKAAATLGVKKINLTSAINVQRSTGYVLGGVSPLGQKKLLPTIIDTKAKEFTTILCSAGKRGLDIELNPYALAKLINANFEEISEFTE